MIALLWVFFCVWGGQGGPEGHQKTVHTIFLASSVVAPSSTENMFVAVVGSLKPGLVSAETFQTLEKEKIQI